MQANTVFRIVQRVLAPALALFLCACAGSGPSPAPQQAVASHFMLGSPDLIETIVIDPLPVAGAVLRLPDGRVSPAFSLDKDRHIYHDQTGYGSGFGFGVSGGSQSRVTTGIGIGFPLFGGWGPSPVVTSTMTTSTIRFRIPDMAAYRRDWQRWILHVDLDDGVSRRAIETLPPAPPQE
jgi:hypothetical protein